MIAVILMLLNVVAADAAATTQYIHIYENPTKMYRWFDNTKLEGTKWVESESAKTEYAPA